MRLAVAQKAIDAAPFEEPVYSAVVTGRAMDRIGGGIALHTGAHAGNVVLRCRLGLVIFSCGGAKAVFRSQFERLVFAFL